MKLFYLSILSFVFVVSFSLSLVKPEIKEISKVIKSERARVNLLPVLASETQTFPIVSAQGVLAVDITTNVTMYEKNADIPMLPASTTKIMTALVALEKYNLDDVIKVPEVKVEGQKMGLVEGEEIRVKDLITGLLVYSANDAAYVLAENYKGGYEEFIKEMNKKAQEIHMMNTHFENPAGLDNLAQVSTVRDLVRLSIEAMKNETFSSLVLTEKTVVTSSDGRIKHYLQNTNELLGKVEGVRGVKTGWTENARENLVTYIERDDKKVMIAVLGSQDRFGETKELIDWIFDSYKWEDVSYSP